MMKRPNIKHNDSLTRSAVWIIFLLCSVSLFAVQRPNIIVFLVDDYDKPETSVYGGKVLTPNLDRLAREGMVFHNAHVTSTVCTPSRYTFLTGRYAGSSHSASYLSECPLGQQGLPAFNVGLESDNMNVGQVLADTGYATGYVGKYHVHDGPYDDVTIPKNVPYTDALNKQKYAFEKKHRQMIMERGFTWAKNIYWGNTKSPFAGHNPEWTTQAALEFIDTHRDQPFYLHCCSTLLHGPNGSWYKSLVDDPRMSGEGKLDKPLGLLDRESILKRIEAAGLTTDEVGYLWMDDCLGLILDKLDELGIADHTIVLFVSDHGSHKKGSLFKSRGTEIPCLVRWPGVIKPGSENKTMIQNTDFAPTWFEVAGAKLPKEYIMDGRSLMPTFKDPKRAVREYVYGEQGPVRSIKNQEWNYISIRYTKDQAEALNGNRAERAAKTLLGLSGGISRSMATHPGALGVDQLYRLDRDPAEQKNLARDPEFAAQLKRMQENLLDTLEKFPRRPYGEFIPGTNTTNTDTSESVLGKLRRYAAKDPKKKKPKK